MNILTFHTLLAVCKIDRVLFLLLPPLFVAQICVGICSSLWLPSFLGITLCIHQTLEFLINLFIFLFSRAAVSSLALLSTIVTLVFLQSFKKTWPCLFFFFFNLFLFIYFSCTPDTASLVFFSLTVPFNITSGSTRAWPKLIVLSKFSGLKPKSLCDSTHF